MPNDDINNLRAKARLAMMGEKRVAATVQESADLTEKRQAAFLAMEGPERRQRREIKEKELREKQEMLRRIDEEVKKREEEAQKQKAEAETARQNEADEKNAELKQKENAYSASQMAIEQLKQERGTTLKAIRTLQSDLADASKAENFTAEKIIIAEQNRQANSSVTASFAPKTTNSGGKIIFWLFLALFVVAGGYGAYWYFSQRKVSTVTAPIVVQSIIFAEKSRGVDTAKIAKENLPGELSALDTVLPSVNEQIGNLYFTKIGQLGSATTTVLLNFSDWQTYSGSAIPADFSRFVSAYMVGWYKNGSTSSAFLALKADPYENVYQTLLSHENDWLRQALQNLDGQDLLAQTASQNFSDYLLKNLNTRVLRDQTGQIVLIYTFLDRQTLIITHSEDALYHAYIVYNTGRTR